jgi:ATP-dependent RNA helicase RhlE
LNFEQLKLNTNLLNSIKTLGYTKPTAIQEKAIPIVLKGNDILGLAQTGTGKTAAFMLPILQRLTADNLNLRIVRALILVPTRELAEQIFQTAVELSKNTKIRIAKVYGGVSKSPQIKALNGRSEIVVACPGRLLDHIDDGKVDLSKLEMLIVDEADKMCDMGFLPDIRRIITYLPKKRQTLFFAATMPDEIRMLSNDILENPITVQIGVVAPVETVSHVIYPIINTLKSQLLIAILEQTATGRVIVFARTKYRAENLARQLAKSKYRVAPLQGNMTQNRRQRAIKGFREGEFDILVATDLASRGLDISEVSHVINFDMPDTVDTYIHRIGRTGRAEKSGEAFTLTIPDDEILIRKIEAILGNSIQRITLPNFNYGDSMTHIESSSRNFRDHTNRKSIKTNRKSIKRKKFVNRTYKKRQEHE